MRDALRLVFGTLTVLPVRPPAEVDRRTAGRAMVLAPVVGLVLAAVVAVGLAVLRLLGDGLPPLLGAALVPALLAALTRGLHLDGLADTADGLGSGRDPAGALEVMRRGDVGPFGVVTLVLVLLAQVAATTTLLQRGHGVAEVAVALVLSRFAVPLLCSHDVPAARADGLGSRVAGTVSRPALLLAAALTLVSVALCLLVDLAATPTGVAREGDAFLLLLAVLLVPVLAAVALAARCVQRLGGITGDVLGAAVETAFTAALVVLALG